MRVLLAHNFYGSSAPSGENSAFEAECDLLIARGHEVQTFTRHSDELLKQGAWGVLKGGLSTVWNPWMARAMESAIRTFQPDVVHVHNTFPLISPAIFSVARGCVACVLTLHNYRLFCANAIPMRAGKVCTECLDRRSAWPALRHGCYRERRMATFPIAASIALQSWLKSWEHKVDAFIALTEFQKELFIRAGLPPARVKVKPNFYPGMPQVTSWRSRDPYVVFAGRLTAEKGVVSLARAWRLWGREAPELRIIGEGALRSEIEKLSSGLPIQFLGRLSPPETHSHIAGARLLIVPSECIEGFPLVIREAFAFGTPVAVSDIGPLPRIVENDYNGLVFQPHAPEGMLSVVREAWGRPELLERMSVGARKSFEETYTEDANHARLIEIYEQALALRRRAQWPRRPS